MAFTEPCPFSSLSLNGFRQQTHLGCSAEERINPQPVSFDVQVYFAEVPPACHTDRLEDTVCYARLSEALKHVCAKQEYQTIEKLGWDAYQAVKDSLTSAQSSQVQIRLRITKERPPIEGLTSGASFTIGHLREI